MFSIKNYITTSHYRMGYRIGKKTVKNFYDKWKDQLTKSSSIEDALKGIQDQVFRIGCSGQVKLYTDRVESFKNSKDEIISTADSQFLSLNKVYQEKKDRLSSEVDILKGQVKDQEQELKKIRDQLGYVINESLGKKESNNNNSRILRTIKATHNIFLETIKHLEKDLLSYAYFGFALLLFAGDYFITYSIFSDILKVYAGITQNGIYIISGVVALVFVVLFDLFIEYVNWNESVVTPYLKEIVKYVIAIIGGLLLIAYILIILVPVMEGFSTRVIDALLRILFVPLVVAVALVVYRIRKDSGFSFLFSPIKIIVIPVVLIVEYFVFVLEWLGIKIKNNFNNSQKLQESKQELMKKIIINDFMSKLGLYERQLLQLGNDLEDKKNHIMTKRDYKISEIDNLINNYLTKIQLLRSGSDKAVVSKLKL